MFFIPLSFRWKKCYCDSDWNTRLYLVSLYGHPLQWKLRSSYRIIHVCRTYLSETFIPGMDET
jgi:hypothetical protein